MTLDFNPRAPRGARPVNVDKKVRRVLFQSTRPARGATLQCSVDLAALGISIHAPREGRDPNPLRPQPKRKNFNPRAPRGARLYRLRILEGDLIFQSTRPARGATVFIFLFILFLYYFNPRAPRGARQKQRQPDQHGNEFQSTRPARGATGSNYQRETEAEFQSTRPARGAT